MHDIIVGFGEVGQALHDVLSRRYRVGVIDTIQRLNGSEFDGSPQVLHICFPYSRHFVSHVRKYVRIFNPKFTVIHSTVPPGTSDKCRCYYSPVRGVHPRLSESLTTFVKFLAPANAQLRKHFEAAGIPIRETQLTRTLEYMKLYCTTIYALNVVVAKELRAICENERLDFEVAYSECNASYNEGYAKLGLPQYSKYILKSEPGAIGGHCLIPNCRLLGTPSAKFVLKQQESFQNETKDPHRKRLRIRSRS